MQRRRRIARPAAAVLACLLAAACGGSIEFAEGADRTPVEADGSGGGAGSGSGDDGATTTTDGAGQGGDEEEGSGSTNGIDLDGVPPDDQDDVIIEAAIDEVETFWADEFPAVYGGTFTPVQGGHVAYGPDRDLPECGPRLTYPEIARNAFYCPSNDLIAWDTDNLTNDLLDEFGAFSLVVVIAHEYGHAIQARVPVSGPTIALEQQADCFAGAFTRFVADGGSSVLEVSEDDLDLAVAGFLTLRDAVGTPASDPLAHGSAFDRVGAFQDGFDNGAARCAEYEEIYDSGGSTVIDIPFTAADLQTQGNAPFQDTSGPDIFDLTLGSLEVFWEDTLPAIGGPAWDRLSTDDQVQAFDPDEPPLPTCDGRELDPDAAAGQAIVCTGDPADPADDLVAFDIGLMEDLYDGIGDFAVAGVLAREYAQVAQALAGITGDALALNLQADCFSGAYTGAVTDETLDRDDIGFPTDPDDRGNPDSQVFISAGDLDEVVQSFLVQGEQGGRDDLGSPFQRVAAFREGFLGGVDACGDYPSGGFPQTG